MTDIRTTTIHVYPTHIDPNYGQLYEYSSYAKGILCAQTGDQIEKLIAGEQEHYTNGKFFDYNTSAPVQMSINVVYH